MVSSWTSWTRDCNIQVHNVTCILDAAITICDHCTIVMRFAYMPCNSARNFIR